jgi:hypothetical protein
MFGQFFRNIRKVQYAVNFEGLIVLSRKPKYYSFAGYDFIKKFDYQNVNPVDKLAWPIWVSIPLSRKNYLSNCAGDPVIQPNVNDNMKTIRITVATLVALIGLTTVSQAQTSARTSAPSVQVVATDAKKFRLSLPVPTAEVALIDAEGTVLYQGVLKPNGQKPTAFNVNTLPDGQYYLTATNDEFWFSQGLTISNNRLTVNAQTMQEVARPTLTAYDRNKFELTLPARNVPAVNVAIYNGNDELVFSDNFRNSPARRFNLDGLPVGDYTVLVGPDQKRFAQRIAIRR